MIENKLLAALTDEDKVAALLTRDDLMLLLEALRYYQGATMCPGVKEMADDLSKLLAAAFPRPTD